MAQKYIALLHYDAKSPKSTADRLLPSWRFLEESPLKQSSFVLDLGGLGEKKVLLVSRKAHCRNRLSLSHTTQKA